MSFCLAEIYKYLHVPTRVSGIIRSRETGSYLEIILETVVKTILEVIVKIRGCMVLNIK